LCLIPVSCGFTAPLAVKYGYPTIPGGSTGGNASPTAIELHIIVNQTFEMGGRTIETISLENQRIQVT